MAIVRPARMIEDRIQTYSVQRHACRHCDAGSLSDVTHPARALAQLRSRLGNQYRAAVSLVNLNQHLVEGAIPRIGVRNHFAMKLPLVVGIIIDTNDIDIFWVATQLRTDITSKHIPRLVLRAAVRLSLRI